MTALADHGAVGIDNAFGADNEEGPEEELAQARGVRDAVDVVENLPDGVLEHRVRGSEVGVGETVEVKIGRRLPYIRSMEPVVVLNSLLSLDRHLPGRVRNAGTEAVE